MAQIDGQALAARVQGLIHGRFGGDLPTAAHALELDERDLRAIVEDATNHPSLEALAAIVQRFGIDACWLLTGEYDWVSHSRQLEEEDTGGSDGPRATILRLVGPGDKGVDHAAKRLA